MLKPFLHYYQDANDENKLLLLLLLILATLSFLLTIYTFLLTNYLFSFIGLLATLTTLSAVTLLYLNKISYDRTSYIIVVGIFFLLLSGFILTENKIEATLYLLAFPVILISLRPDSEWSISIFAFIMVMVTFQIFGLTVADYSWEEMTNIWLTLGATAIFLGVYVLMSRETKAELSLQREKLKQINDSLEEKVRIRTEELQRLNNKLSIDITLDPVTKIMNKRTFIEKLRQQVERFKNDHIHFSIITFDLDNFNQINHCFGRKVGDEILTKIAQMVSQNSLALDIVARTAGDEFAILMHNSSKEQALERAEKIRQHIEWAVFVDTQHITASFGVLEFREITQELDEYIILHELDLALQKAKHRGKNMVC